MSNSVKCMKLDFLLLKPYLKSVLLTLIMPLIVSYFTGTLFEGLFLATTIMAMTTNYTFSVVEKNNLNRYYGFIPVNRNHLVMGRYLIVFLLGFVSLLVTSAAQVVIFTLKDGKPSVSEIFVSFMICAVFYSIYAGIQIPGYYRFGSIKGKMFMFIPTIGFLLLYYVLKSWNVNINISFDRFSSTAVIAAGAVLLIFLIILISSAISKKIVGKHWN